jgi:hypothetical protein
MLRREMLRRGAAGALGIFALDAGLATPEVKQRDGWISEWIGSDKDGSITVEYSKRPRRIAVLRPGSRTERTIEEGESGTAALRALLEEACPSWTHDYDEMDVSVLYGRLTGRYAATYTK